MKDIRVPSHPDRVRSAPLPEGYQFGEARPPEQSLEGATVMIDGVLHVVGPAWRPPHANAAEQLVRQFDVVENRTPARFACEWPTGWNVIEGDH